MWCVSPPYPFVPLRLVPQFISLLHAFSFYYSPFLPASISYSPSPFPLSPSSFTPHPPPLPPHFPIQLILLPCECVTFSLCAYLRLATAERTCKPSVRRCVYIRVRLYWGVSINRYVNVHTCVQLYITPESGTLSSHPPFSLEHTLTYVILARGKNCT